MSSPMILSKCIGVSRQLDFATYFYIICAYMTHVRICDFFTLVFEQTLLYSSAGLCFMNPLYVL